MSKHLIFVFLLILTWGNVSAQAPLNDDCENAHEISIPDQGYAFGKFSSTPSDVTAAGREQAEHCIKELEESGNCSKTVWFKFYIGSTRNLSVKLTQKDSAIPQIFAGFNVYQIPDCNYKSSNLSRDLVPLNKFGLSGNTCLSEGWYLIQVGCKQKARGLLWVELDVAPPGSADYDNTFGMYKFYPQSNLEYRNSFNFNCTSLEPGESEGIADHTFKNSIWFSVVFRRNSQSKSIRGNFSGFRNTGLKYRIFRDQVNADSLKSNKPFKELGYDGIYYQSECAPSFPGEEKLIVQLISSNENNYVQVYVNQSNFIEDAWNTPSTDNVYDLDYNDVPRRMKYFNCDALLSKHSCKNKVPNYFLKETGQTIIDNDGQIIKVIDTFKYGSYTIIKAKESGRLQIKTDIVSTDGYLHHALYLGDIRNSCQLQLLKDTFIHDNYFEGFNHCVNAGNTYTLVTSVKNLNYVQHYQTVSLHKYKPVKKFYYPKIAEQLNPYHPITDASFSSVPTNFRSHDTLLQVDTVQIKGSMSYHEIFILGGSDFTIQATNCAIYVFGGRISDGSAYSLSNVNYLYPNHILGVNQNSGTFFSDRCFSLPEGVYTVVCVMPEHSYSDESQCYPNEHWINFYRVPPCQFNNVEPENAFPINGNLDVLTANDKLDGISYIYDLKFCKDCQTGSKIKPVLSCKTLQLVNSNTNYYYFTFYLGENASFFGPSIFEIYEGNVTADPFLVQDSSKIISPCSNGNIICNLKGKRTYTMVIPDNTQYSNFTTISFVKHLKSPNDFAIKAHNLGHFSKSESKASPFFPITCHTGSFKTDPSNYLHNSKYFAHIPYLDTLNNRRTTTIKNIWYTFTVSGSCNIKLEVLSKNTRYRYNDMILCRYKGKYREDFQQTLNNQFDSSLTGMEWLSMNNNDINFYNDACQDYRYFVLIQSQYSGNEVQLKVSTTPVDVVTKGDFCNNAMAGLYTTYGDYSLNTNNSCHSLGNSPFEEEIGPEYKTSWFKIKVEGLKKFDLKIRSTYAYGMVGFNVYGGTCGAMTRISQSASAYSYFTLTCMGSGEYFIQIICHSNINSDIGCYISISPPENPVCKPYDFINPLALFNLKGGCHKQDSIFIDNLSTAGKDIVYSWYINGQYRSAAAEPVFLRTDPLLLDQNTIRLIVFNSVELTSDTIEMSYIRDTTTYHFDIVGPEISHCYDSLHLSVNTNFQRKLNYNWRFLKSNYILSQEAFFSMQATYDLDYVLTAESDNCEFTDTFYINFINTLHRFKDSLLCQGQKYVIKNNSNNYMSVDMVYLMAGDSVVVTESKNMLVTYTDSVCQYIDTVDIVIEKGPKLLNRMEDVYYCNVNEVELKYTKDPLYNHSWSTGETTESIKVTQSGTYQLFGSFSKCRNLQQTYKLLIENINTDRIKDSILCLYDEFKPYNPYGNRFDILYQSPNQNTTVRNEFLHVLKVKRGECLFSDSGMVKLFPHKGRSIDTFYCEHSLAFEFQIDAGKAINYNWYQNQSNARVLKVNAYGYYPVARIDMNTCRDTLKFNLITNCEFNVYIPNAFSPNNDLNNEQFSPRISGYYQNFNMLIFNRWGEQILESTVPSWDGTYQGLRVMSGIYSYLITVCDKDGKSHLYRGTVHLID